MIEEKNENKPKKIEVIKGKSKDLIISDVKDNLIIEKPENTKKDNIIIPKNFNDN